MQSQYLTVIDYELQYELGVKWSRYRPGVAQRVGRGIALLFYDRGTRRGWVISSMPRPHFTPGKDPVPILQETGWAPGPVWTDEKSCPHRDSIWIRGTFGLWAHLKLCTIFFLSGVVYNNKMFCHSGLNDVTIWECLRRRSSERCSALPCARIYFF